MFSIGLKSTPVSFSTKPADFSLTIGSKTESRKEAQRFEANMVAAKLSRLRLSPKEWSSELLMSDFQKISSNRERTIYEFTAPDLIYSESDVAPLKPNVPKKRYRLTVQTHHKTMFPDSGSWWYVPGQKYKIDSGTGYEYHLESIFSPDKPESYSTSTNFSLKVKSHDRRNGFPSMTYRNESTGELYSERFQGDWANRVSDWFKETKDYLETIS